MPDFLLELRSEEIPARMQRKAAGDLKKLVTDALVDAGLTYEGCREYWTPRRLTLDLRGLTARSADIKEERKGPRTDAPEKAITGFLRGARLESVEQAEIRTDPKKGEFLVAVIEKPGRDAAEIIASALPGIIENFPWPKSMRWGAKSATAGSLRWVRPLQSIIALLGVENDETEIVPFEVSGIASGKVTYGHRFHAPEEITVRRFDDYVAKLEAANVVLDAERRKDIIRADAANLAFAKGLELVEDEGLLEEVANLVEWPVALLGEFGADYLDIPPEVIRLTIKENQKCFVLRKQGEEALSNTFLLVSNVDAHDGGTEIARGNAKVVNARLSDAKFFWETDLHTIATEGFEPWIAKLDTVTFHAKLGSQGDRVQRMKTLSNYFAEKTGASSLHVTLAVHLSKADLQSQMVYEFPELQGEIGRRYANEIGVENAVAEAIEQHYAPLGPTDKVPNGKVSVSVSLSEKIDVVTCFWAIDEKPTGSKDPFALRRAAIGAIRTIVEKEISCEIGKAISIAYETLLSQKSKEDTLFWEADRSESFRRFVPIDATISGQQRGFPKGSDDPIELSVGEGFVAARDSSQTTEVRIRNDQSIQADGRRTKLASFDEIVGGVLSFFHDRLKVYLRDSGARHDLIDAVITPTSDDLLAITRRVEALGSFLDTDDGKNLLAGTKRAANILAAEEKKGTAVAESVDPALFDTDRERALFDSLEEAEAQAKMAIEAEDYAKAMSFLSRLRAPVDAFFEDVMVNAEDDTVRANRLALMRRIRDATGTVADFSKIAG